MSKTIPRPGRSGSGQFFRALAGLPVRLRNNADFAQGQTSSVCAGLAALTQATDAVMVCLGDMVLLTSADYRELIARFALLTDHSILVPQYRGQRGNPVVIAQWRLPQIVLGQRNLGCRKLIAEHPEDVFVHESAHDRVVADLDTPEDYARLLRRLQAASGTALEPST